MGGGVLEGHDQAGGRVGCGGDGDSAVVFSEAGAGVGDGLLHFQSFSSALHHWLCFGVHFQPGKCYLDPHGLSFHGIYLFLFNIFII